MQRTPRPDRGGGGARRDEFVRSPEFPDQLKALRATSKHRLRPHVDQRTGHGLKAQFAASFPTAALNNVKWYPAVPAGLEEIEGRVLDRIKAAN